MTQIIHLHSDSQEEESQPNLVQTFTAIQNILETEEFFAKIRAMPSLKTHQQKQITTKMRGKLLGWLQKVSLNTFKFNRSTFITSVAILDQYLMKNDDAPSILQLLGCASLFIAAKLCEQIIVAPQCYASACCNIFNKHQLLEKERQVYADIDWKKIRTGVFRAVKIGSQRLNLQAFIGRAEDILSILLKEDMVYSWKDSKVIYAVLSILKIDSQEKLANQDILQLIKTL